MLVSILLEKKVRNKVVAMARATLKRAQRVRNKLRRSGRTRLSVFVSNSNIYAQLIDDSVSKTVASSSSRALKTKAANSEAAKKVGQDIAEKAKKLKITEIVYDRGSYLYHGKVKALADAARESGLKF